LKKLCFVFIFKLIFQSDIYYSKTAFVIFKMASDVQDGGRNSKKRYFIIVQYFCVLFFAISLYFCQQRKSIAYFVKLVQNGGSNGRLKSDFFA
jgi:hypothetical protein